MHLKRRIASGQTQGYFRASRSLQQFHDPLVVQLGTRNGQPFNLENAVARLDPCLFRRSPRNGRHHHQRIVLDDELHANAFEVSLHVLGHGGQFFATEIHRVRVQFLQHGLDGGIHQLAPVEAVHVQIFDAVKHIQQARLVARCVPVAVKRHAGIRISIAVPTATSTSEPQSCNEGHGQGQRLSILHSDR